MLRVMGVSAPSLHRESTDSLIIQDLLHNGKPTTQEISNLEREYRDCIKKRRDKIGITRHIMMHQVLRI